ncbi:MAG: GNAT family N-acetyltransferase [Clostridia bacterium]|nr:GNAT family N-acetyltransferase [Clostridia bacterium]
MFRKATLSDLDAISRIYDAIHDCEEAGAAHTGWKRGIYPVRSTAEAAIAADDLFVLEQDGEIVASARINKIQVAEYQTVTWSHEARDEEVMVLHTLAVAPWVERRGYGTSFVKFYEEYAKENGCPYLRMDTNEKNARARALYKKLGYAEKGIVPCVFNGIEDVNLVCLEKTLHER